jgi:protein-S-isoprenylcysteine O-methyltransferase Ste14
MHDPPPSLRKVAAAGLIVLLILVWALLVAVVAPYIARWPVLVQALFYLIVGIAWIIPLKPLLRWSETGSWKAVRKRDGERLKGGGTASPG